MDDPPPAQMLREAAQDAYLAMRLMRLDPRCPDAMFLMLDSHADMLAYALDRQHEDAIP